MTFRLTLTPEAAEQIQEIQEYISSKSFPESAASYVHRLADHLEGIAAAPYQGTKRDDLGRGFRTTGFERRVTVVYVIRGEDVIIAGIYYGGRQIPKDIQL